MSLVLVVYEQEAEQESIEKLLCAKGHNVLKARNGLEAIDLVRREHPDAALSDVLLPRMDGFALCRKWKQDDRLQTAPFMFYTTRYDDPKYERFAQEVGADRFFAGAEAANSVVSALDEALENNRRGTGTLRINAEDVVAAFEREKERELERQRESKLERQREADRERDKALGALKARVAELDAARQRHAAAESAYRSLFESAPVPMWIQEEQTARIVAVNDAALTRYGYGRAEFLALEARALQPGDERPIAATYDRPSPRQHRRKDGAFIEVELHAQTVPWHGRRALLVAAHDVTERLRALRALAEREETHRRIVTALPEAVLLIDAQGRITEANEHACLLTGRPREELHGTAFTDLVPEPALQDASEATQRVQIAREDEDRGPLEFDVRTASLGSDGRRVAVLRHVVPTLVEDTTAPREHDLAHAIRALALLDDSLPAGELLRIATAAAAALTGSALSYAHVLDRGKGVLRLAEWFDAQRDAGATVDGEPRSPARSGVFGQAAASRSTAVINDPTPRAQPDGLPDLGRCLVVPLLEGDEVLAVLGVANRDTEYEAFDRDLLERYAAVVALVYVRRRRESALADRVEQLARTAEATIESLGAVAAHLDPRGSQHARRVAALAAAIGRELGLEEPRIDLLQTAGLLHDLGMAALPGGLVSAPRALEPAERALLTRHPEMAAQFLAGVDGGGALATMIRQHHERLDGSGYPAGLTGEEIELGGRVLAVADTLCAITEHRAHRPAQPLDAALAEIEKFAGRRFDPHVVAACVRLFRKQGFELPD